MGLAALLASFLALGCGSSSKTGEQSAMSQARGVVRSLDAPMDRLSEALAAAKPSQRASMVMLRASADRASGAIRRTLGEVREIADGASDEDRRPLDGIVDALNDLRSLADTLATSRLSVTELEVGGERARQAMDDAGLDFSPLATEQLAAAIRKAKATTPAKTGTGVSAPVGSDPSISSQSSASSLSYFTYYGPAFQARLPDGAGWGSPAQSQPTPGELYRTSVRGPNGLFVIIDYTPFETARFGGRYSSRTRVGQTAFGSATRYVFQGGRLPECQRSPCVDYLINDASDGSGFGVLAGGPNFSTAAALAQTVGESVVPSDGE